LLFSAATGGGSFANDDSTDPAPLLFGESSVEHESDVQSIETLRQFASEPNALEATFPFWRPTATHAALSAAPSPEIHASEYAGGNHAQHCAVYGCVRRRSALEQLRSGDDDERTDQHGEELLHPKHRAHASSSHHRVLIHI